MIFAHETLSADYRDQMDGLISKQNNPFVDMYHWCKGEIYDLQALCDAVASREAVEKQQKKLELKKKNTQADLDHVKEGKKTVRTLFKNEKDSSGMMNSIENVIQLFLIYFIARKRN